MTVGEHAVSSLEYLIFCHLYYCFSTEVEGRLAMTSDDYIHPVKLYGILSGATCRVLKCSFDFELTFGVSVLNMTKVERLQYGESLMTHAMVLTGVHIEVSLPFTDHCVEEFFCGLAFSGSNEAHCCHSFNPPIVMVCIYNVYI